MIGLRISRAQRGATSRTKTAVATPRGSAMTMEAMVTRMEPRIRGSVPKSLNVGYQRVEKRPFSGTSKKTGSPSRRRKRKMRSTNPIVEKPSTRMSASTTNSLTRRGLMARGRRACAVPREAALLTARSPEAERTRGP